jgi:hypothetical protein
MISLKSDERELYEARLKLTRDERAKLDYAREEGSLMGRVTLLESLLGLPTTSREELERLGLEELRTREQALLAQTQNRPA